MIEVVTVLGIIAILAGLSAAALTRLKTRGNFASATGDFVATLRSARAEAFGRGDNTVVVVDTANGQWWSIEDVAGNFTLTGFDGGIAPPNRIMYYGSLPAGTSFGPSSGIGTALAMPYCGIPTGSALLADGGTGCTVVADGGTSSPNLPYCSFCDPGTGMGAVTFLPSGGAQFSGGPLTVGQQVALQNTSATTTDGGPAGVALGVIDFAIVGATGAIEAVTVK